jgi:formylglycine-generating enzyme required for sulfatase activity
MSKGWQIKGLIAGTAAFVLIAAGISASDKLLNGQKTNKEICPADMVFIENAAGGFCLDRYEASTGENCPSIRPMNQQETRANLENGQCFPRAKAGFYPWSFISQNQAQSACAKAGKRLPTSAEWQMGALNTPDKNESWNADDCQVAKNWTEQPGISGSAINCKSSAGVFDMIGNAWEWTADTITEGKFNGRELPEKGYVAGVDENGLPSNAKEEADENYFGDYCWIKKSGVRGVARGGYWDNGSRAGAFSSYLVSEPSFAGEGVGFRCAKNINK